jgi:hypothetical protein
LAQTLRPCLAESLWNALVLSRNDHLAAGDIAHGLCFACQGCIFNVAGCYQSHKRSIRIDYDGGCPLARGETPGSFGKAQGLGHRLE